MPPAKTQIACPNCHQPLVAEVQQLFDLNEDPAAKQRLLSGATNMIQCPHCGYQGSLATPIVYHDPEKELLLAFVPPELGLPRDEQEKLVGRLINQVIEGLPQEKRKGYLFSPQSTLTHQGLIERVLEADGITREMIQAQEQKLNLLQRLMNSSDDSRAQIAAQEDELLDGEFFTLLSRLAESSMASGDQESARRFAGLQEQLLPLTTFGKQLQEQIGELEAAAKSLQDAGEGLTREKLLDLVLEAPNDTRLRALVSMARPGMDYSFFQILSERIEQATEESERERLVALREKLLEMTREVDEQMQVRVAQARQLLNAIVQSHNVAEATAQNLGDIDQFFLEVLEAEMKAARQTADLARLEKLQTVAGVLEAAGEPPPEIALIQELVNQPGDEAWQRLLEERAQEISPQFLETLTALLAQAQSGDNPQLSDRLRAIHRQAVRLSIQARMKST